MTESRSVIARGQQEGEAWIGEKEGLQRDKETSGNDGYIYHLAFGDGFMRVNVCPDYQIEHLNCVQFTVCPFYLNKAVKKQRGCGLLIRS